MSRRALVAAAVGAGLLLGSLPALAHVEARPAAGRAERSEQAEAVALLERAAVAGRRLSYSGTQYAATWRGDEAATSVVELVHDPVHGSLVHGDPREHLEAAAGTALLDPRMLDRLSSSYDLAVTGSGRCAGRTAAVVEASRADGSVAGRFWVDRDSGMLLRREVFDDAGRRVRSSAFVDLSVDTPPAGAGALEPLRTPPVRAEELARLRAEGWHVPERLPDGFRLFETRVDGEVLHLAYTDGLSTLSLFEQRGRLGSAPMDGFTAEHVDGWPVHVRRTAPERVVWAGGPHVFTLVSDAPESSVRAAVAALPHDGAGGSGVLDRLVRGASRLAGMLNPFG